MQQVSFFLPQLVQLLRGNETGHICNFLLREASCSPVFAHRLVCTLRSEGTPPPDAFAPAVKRSGWKPPSDSGLWGVADAVGKQACPLILPFHLQDQLSSI